MANAILRTSHSCGTKKGLVCFDDGNAYCFKCGTFIPDYLTGDELKTKTRIGKSKEQIEQELNNVKEFPNMDFEFRKIKPEYYNYFNVKYSFSEVNREPEAVYFPYTLKGELSGYKVRLIEEKRMWSIGRVNPECELFGWTQAITTGSRKLFITEGEYDAIALYQILHESQKGTQWADRRPAVVSLPNGVSSASKAILNNLKEINNFFQEIVLVFDNDEAGNRATEEVLRVVPEAKVATLPLKDANECLDKGQTLACKNAVLFQAKSNKNTRIVSGASLRELALKQPEFGAPYPWDWLTRKTRGIRFGETIYLGAGQKQGKSEIVNTLAAWCMKDLDWNVFLVKPEEANPKTYKMVAGKMEGKFFHDPTKDFDKEAFDRAADILDKKMYLLDLYQHVGWDSLKQDIRTAVEKNNCKAVFIDPITNLVNGMDAASANTKLQEIAQELSAMAKDLNCVIFIFCHLRNPDNGPPHERGGKVLSSQFAGSRAMARSCNYMLGLEGNRDPELSEEERNMRKLVLLEDREYGEVGELNMYWDSKTGLFNPMEG